MSETRASAGSSRVWYRSFYWRIALGFVAFLAVLLVAQALLFVVLAGRTGGLYPATSNARLAEIIASDLREELERNDALDIGAHLAREYSRVVQPFIVVLADGSIYSNRETPAPPLVRSARFALRRLAGGRVGPPPPRRADDPDGRGSFSPIVARQTLV